MGILLRDGQSTLSERLEILLTFKPILRIFRSVLAIVDMSAAQYEAGKSWHRIDIDGVAHLGSFMYPKRGLVPTPGPKYHSHNKFLDVEVLHYNETA